MRINKCNAYITKEEAILAMRKGRTNEEREWAISAVKATRVKRSLKITPTYLKRGDEHCPHCRRDIELYYLGREVPRFCYCFYCGGAIYRPRARGNKNPSFDWSILTPEQAKEWGVERYVNGETDKEDDK